MKKKLLVLLIAVAVVCSFGGGFGVAKAVPDIGIPELFDVSYAVKSFKISTVGWTQEEKNMVQAAAVSLLFQANITYSDIYVVSTDKDSTISVVDPSQDPKNVLTAENLKAYIVAELERQRIASQEAQAEAQAREQVLATSKFTDMKLADIDAEIDAIKDVEQLKAYIKELVRYIIAKQ